MKDAITMPVLSDTMTTGRLVRWLKQPGDAVKKGDAVAEVESDKATMEVEAYRDGYLAGPLAPVDTEIPVHQPIGYVADEPGEAGAPQARVVPEHPTALAAEKGTAPAERAHAAAAPALGPAQPAAASPARPSQAPTPAAPERPAPARETEQAAFAESAPPSGGGEGPRVSPYARALAHDLGVEIGQILPGRDGAIGAPEVVAALLRGPQPALRAGPPWRTERLTPMRRAVARNMRATLGTPTFRVSTRVALQRLERAAQEHRWSLTLLIARAGALTIAQHPLFNAVYTLDGLARRDRVDVGIAVDLEDGLITPVLRDAAERPLAELAEAWRVLHDRASRRHLTPAEYHGATFYVSNLGVFPDVHAFDTVLPLGAASILAVAAATEQGAALTLTCDHRVVFGADAARFLTTLKGLIEKPDAWCGARPGA